MIQRKQTLYLLVQAFLGISLLFVPAQTVSTEEGLFKIVLEPVETAGIQSSIYHYAAIVLNFLAIVLTFLAVFLYKKRELQRNICFILVAMWIATALLMSFMPFVERTGDMVSLEKNYFAPFLALCSAVAAYIAARFIKKDIELLKSADRFR